MGGSLCLVYKSVNSPPYCELNLLSNFVALLPSPQTTNKGIKCMT